MINIFEVMDAIDFQSDTLSVYVNKCTGKVELLLDDEHFDSIQELEDSLSSLDDEEEIEHMHVVKRILFSNDYLQLPSAFDIHEYQIMKDFGLSIEDTRMRENLLNELIGDGAFRRFIDFINLAGLQEDWYAYRYESIKNILIEWCQENRLKYSEEELGTVVTY